MIPRVSLLACSSDASGGDECLGGCFFPLALLPLGFPGLSFSLHGLLLAALGTATLLL